ncbi:putative phage abortive infection protein [Maribacter litoralis]|uniref:putative phage abortive infection protein n=1 Tax=Maribacter litoralis TaxID=2059726 RepID=UPI003D27C643
MKFNLNKTEIIVFILIGFGIAVLPLIFTQDWTGISFMTTGQIGDTIGGVTAPFLAFFGSILVYGALKAQIEANSSIQRQFVVQQFESRFYKMIDLHVENVRGFSVQEFKLVDSSGYQAVGEISGRRVFLPMIKEFHFLLEIIYSFYMVPTSKINLDLNKLAYEIFFYGITSEHVKPIDKTDKTFDDLKKKLIRFRRMFRDTRSTRRTLNSEYPKLSIEVTLRYVPFSGHESRLGVYFRHLYQTVKQVNESEVNEIIDYDSARRYLAILRGQLTNQEQQLLYYNYLFGSGDDWDKLGGRHQFLTYYRMIHNIPLDDGRISELVENPRIHFKDYIENHCTREDPLFDWGDFVN